MSKGFQNGMLCPHCTKTHRGYWQDQDLGGRLGLVAKRGDS